MSNYQHISPEERASIQIKLDDQCSLREIARHIGRSPSTVSREIKRQKHPEEYNATVAGAAYRERRKRSVRPRKLREGQALYDRVSTLLECRQWSPEQISERLKIERPDDPNWRVSHETIYSTIYAYPRNELKKLFIAQLRQAKAEAWRAPNSQGHCSRQSP